MEDELTGAALKSLRSRLGLTQAALAEAVGVVPNTLARWERGEIGVPGWAVERLHAASRSGSSGSAVTRPRGVVVLDPHHGEILSALDGSLDPEIFEACAAELLRHDWPGLVAVRGGQDDGFDGAVADGVRREPFPLVVTTATDLKGNLRRNLERARRKWATVDRALFATSRRVTPRMRQKLEAMAADIGAPLRQIYDQDWFAHRLYRDPVWCKRLLGVTGRPRALSPFPVTRRPVLGDRILGRERETRWLQERRGDCLLVGAPGSGKTFLLRALVLQGQALFQVAADREHVANDLRELKPPTVIVDDAHVDPDEIARFIQIRREMDSDVRIIATSWPGAAPAVLNALQIPSTEVRHLDLIDADTMIEIIKSVGLTGPDELLRVIRQQADGRPGLAATLAHLCLAGDVRRAASGEALVDQLAPQLGRMLDIEDATRFLAPFALGGDAGVRLEPVAERLGRRIDEVGSSLAGLAEAGIVLERSNHAVSVEPPPMRWVLVRRAFFDGAGSLQPAPFLSIVENREDAIHTLIGARSRGASAPELENLLERSESSRLWSEYASLGPSEARYVIERRPGRLLDVAEEVLEHVPETVIPLLLGMVRAADAPRPEPPLSQGPLDVLTRWTTRLPSDRNEWFHRRSTLMRAADRWRRDGGDAIDAIVALRAACIALHPECEYGTTDPGRGQTITIHSDTLSRVQVEQLGSLWPIALDLLQQLSDARDAPWRDLLSLVSGWAHYRVRRVSSETQSAIKKFTKRMLQDLADASRRHPGLQHALKTNGEGSGLKVDVTRDPDFEMLHQRLGPDDEMNMMESGPPDGIVEDWERRSPEETARVLARIESEANLAGIGYPRWSPRLCARLAERVADPAAVSRMFIKHELPADLVGPFVLRAARSNAPRWPELVRGCLDDNRLRELAIYATVTHAAPPPELLTRTLDATRDFSQSIYTWCLRDEVPPVTLRQMFLSTDGHTATAAAIGHWVSIGRNTTGPKTRCPSCDGEVAANDIICWTCGQILNMEEYKKHKFADETVQKHRLHDAWRQAILHAPANKMGLSDHDKFWLHKILSKSPCLAEDWIATRFGRSGHGVESGNVEDIATKVVPVLDTRQRARILMALRSDCHADELVKSLVDNDVSLYRRLLETSDLAEYHLAPLAGKPCEAWRKKALAALDHDYSIDAVTDATLPGRSWVWSGPMSEMWAGWRRAFETLHRDADPRIADIGRRGADVAGEQERWELEFERREAVHGR